MKSILKKNNVYSSFLTAELKWYKMRYGILFSTISVMHAVFAVKCIKTYFRIVILH